MGSFVGFSLGGALRRQAAFELWRLCQYSKANWPERHNSNAAGSVTDTNSDDYNDDGVSERWL
jgi:hypothetical protein